MTQTSRRRDLDLALFIAPAPALAGLPGLSNHRIAPLCAEGDRAHYRELLWGRHPNRRGHDGGPPRKRQLILLHVGTEFPKGTSLSMSHVGRQMSCVDLSTSCVMRLAWGMPAWQRWSTGSPFGGSTVVERVGARGAGQRLGVTSNRPATCKGSSSSSSRNYPRAPTSGKWDI